MSRFYSGRILEELREENQRLKETNKRLRKRIRFINDNFHGGMWSGDIEGYIRDRSRRIRTFRRRRIS